jgi:hypothetical protein
MVRAVPTVWAHDKDGNSAGFSAQIYTLASAISENTYHFD